MSMATLDPLAAYDVRDDTYVSGETFWPFDAWAVEHGISLHDTFRIEIHLLDCPFARVFQFDKNAAGQIYVDPATGDVALREPFDVPLSSMPPVKPRPARRSKGGTG